MAPRLHMRDRCEVGTYDTDTTGPEPGESWTYEPETRCRFTRTTSREVLDGNEHALTDVAIHFPVGTTLSASSRIKLTRRNGSTLTSNEFYEVVGEPWYTDDNRVVVINAQSVPAGATA